MEINYKNVIVLSNLSGWKHGFVQTNPDWTGSNWEETQENSKQFFTKNLEESKGYEIKIKKAFKNNQINFLFCFRNPYDNFLSMFKHAKDKDTFHIWFVDNWNKKNKNYLDFIENSNNTHLFKFESFPDDTKEVFDNLKLKFSLETKNKNYQNVENTVNPRLTMGREKFVYSKFDESQFIDKDLKKYFENNLDLETMNKLNYRILK